MVGFEQFRQHPDHAEVAVCGRPEQRGQLRPSQPEHRAGQCVRHDGRGRHQRHHERHPADGAGNERAGARAGRQRPGHVGRHHRGHHAVQPGSSASQDRHGYRLAVRQPDGDGAGQHLVGHRAHRHRQHAATGGQFAGLADAGIGHAPSPSRSTGWNTPAASNR
ncbi:hypothetical protein G6F65_021411 [Rhizopus arrhizus]|nr:hypothetical protein G6F65_021411 [Rhizopus arrhizus]